MPLNRNKAKSLSSSITIDSRDNTWCNQLGSSTRKYAMFCLCCLIMKVMQTAMISHNHGIGHQWVSKHNNALQLLSQLTTSVTKSKGSWIDVSNIIIILYSIHVHHRFLEETICCLNQETVECQIADKVRSMFLKTLNIRAIFMVFLCRQHSYYSWI
jgi:hypothetical protein